MDDFWGPFTQQPNILILMTDQQRTAQHFPPDWVAENLPNLNTLIESGVSFPNGMTNTTACSPSRATLFSGTYPTLNGVTSVGDTLETVGQPIQLPNGSSLPLATLGQILQDSTLLPSGVEYQIGYKGKWHLDANYQSELSPSEQANPDVWSALTADDSDMQNEFGFPGWTSQDFGDAIGKAQLPPDSVKFNSLGGGVGENDARITSGTSYGSEPVQNALEFLQTYQPNSEGTNPFLLIVSLCNPHDIWVSPNNYAGAGYTTDEDGLYPWQKAPFTDIEVPDTYQLSSQQIGDKPSVQAQYRTDYDLQTATDYIRFYAYLETLSDALLGDVVASLQNNENNLQENTLIVRLADHGEMGMAQGAMIEKEHQVYNETLLVPMIFSNPGLTQQSSTNQLVGLIDIIPTLAEISGINVDDLTNTYAQQGSSIANLVLNPNSTDSDQQFLFATDDNNAHIRCLIDAGDYNAKYAVYYDVQTNESNPNGTASNFQYEMYPFSSDADTRDDEATNMLPVDGLGSGDISDSTQTLWHNMHVALTAELQQYGQQPDDWPDAPPLPG